MGAAPDTVLVHQNASIANSILFGALDFSDRRRDKVVITELDFPSDVYALRSWLPDHMRIHTVRSRDGVSIDIDELLDAIDERTRLVSTRRTCSSAAPSSCPRERSRPRRMRSARKCYSMAITASA